MNFMEFWFIYLNNAELQGVKVKFENFMGTDDFKKTKLSEIYLTVRDLACMCGPKSHSENV